MLTSYELWDFASLILFVGSWVGYAIFSRKMAKKARSLSSVLIILRIDWMKHLLERENRILDAALMANIEKNINFLASTTLLVIAGALTALTSAQAIHDMTNGISWVWPQTLFSIQLKVLCIILILIYAFFKFTWALRQYGFVSVLIGAAPNLNDEKATEEMKKSFSINAGKLLDQAGHNFNHGMRSYYFALAVVGWFLHPLLFCALTLIVIRILYHREFKSHTLKTLVDSLNMSRYFLETDEHILKTKE